MNFIAKNEHMNKKGIESPNKKKFHKKKCYKF